MKRDNRNIKVAKNCPTLVTVLIEFRVHSFEIKLESAICMEIERQIYGHSRETNLSSHDDCTCRNSLFRILLQAVIERDDVKYGQYLALVVIDPSSMNVEHRRWVYFDFVFVLDEFSQHLFVELKFQKLNCIEMILHCSTVPPLKDVFGTTSSGIN